MVICCELSAALFAHGEFATRKGSTGESWSHSQWLHGYTGATRLGVCYHFWIVHGDQLKVIHSSHLTVKIYEATTAKKQRDLGSEMELSQLFLLLLVAIESIMGVHSTCHTSSMSHRALLCKFANERLRQWWKKKELQQNRYAQSQTSFTALRLATHVSAVVIRTG